MNSRDEWTEQEWAREEEALRLARLLEHVTTLQDTVAWARGYWDDVGRRRWRRVDHVGIVYKYGPSNDAATARGAPRVRQALRRKDHDD